MNKNVELNTKSLNFRIIKRRGITLKLYLEMKGDTVIQILPCDDSHYYDKDNCVIQKYVRVD